MASSVASLRRNLKTATERLDRYAQQVQGLQSRANMLEDEAARSKRLATEYKLVARDAVSTIGTAARAIDSEAGVEAAEELKDALFLAHGRLSRELHSNGRVDHARRQQ